MGRRLVEVLENRASGGYRVFTVLDRNGHHPLAGQFYMLATAERWGAGGERPYLPRAFSVASSSRGRGGVRLGFLAEEVGPASERLCRLAEGEKLWITGPLGRGFSAPRDLRPGAAGAVLVGGGVGIAPLAIWRDQLATGGIAVRTLLGFRDREHTGGLELFDCPEVGLASEDGHLGHRGYVTDLLSAMLAGDDAGTAAVYACGPPGMLETVRALCARRRVAAELAMETPMACGFGACMGCAVPLARGGYMRLCVDGAVVDASEVATAAFPGSGHR